MFTGIIETAGKVSTIERQSESVRLTVSAGQIAEDVVQSATRSPSMAFA